MPDQASRVYPTKPSDIYLFATCLVDQFAPEAGLDAVRLIEREGIRVHFPMEQTCCGQPAYTSGFPDEARAVARRQFALFPEPWPVVVPSGSCAGMMRHHYPKLFADDPEWSSRAHVLGERIFELTEFLVHVAGFQPDDLAEPTTVLLHTSCSARREMGVHVTSRVLLDGLDNVTVAKHAHEEECCGFGGTFSLRHPEVSAAIALDKVIALRNTQVGHVVSADCGCLLNIIGRASHVDTQAGLTSLALTGEHIASFLWHRTGGKVRECP